MVWRTETFTSVIHEDRILWPSAGGTFRRIKYVEKKAKEVGRAGEKTGKFV